MKKVLALSLLTLFSFTLFAQPAKHMGGPRHKDDYANVEKLVSNLTSSQKKRIESITDKAKKDVNKLRSELESLRGQIGELHAKEGDQSSALFPLYDREGQLMSQISKEMYKCRVQIDEVLNPEQIKEMRESLEVERQKHLKNKPTQNSGTKKSKIDSQKGSLKKD